MKMNKSPPKNNAGSDVLETLFFGLGRGFIGFFRCEIYGIKRMFRPGVFAGLVAMSALGFVVLQNQTRILSLETVFGEPFPTPFRYILYWAGLFLPFWYLAIIGALHNQKIRDYFNRFAEVGFCARNGQFPYFTDKKKEGYRQIITFKSTIPIKEWEREIGLIETALDCTIRRVEGVGRSKRSVKLVTVPSNFQIPTILNWKDEQINPTDGEIVIGESDIDKISFNLNNTPHVICAGETGSGKSVLLRCMLWQMIAKGARVYMVDFKGGVEFGLDYEEYGEVVMERERAVELFGMLVDEINRRLALFRPIKAHKLPEYNAVAREKLCRICVFCDEIGEMLDKKGASKEDKVIFEKLEGYISTIARLGRAPGVNLFFGVQRPDANVITGQIKSNIPVRISGRFADKPASEIVLDNTAAVDLPNIKGRFIFKLGNELTEIQSYYFSDDRDLHEVDGVQGIMLHDSENKPRKVPEKSSENAPLSLEKPTREQVLDEEKKPLSLAKTGKFSTKKKENPNPKPSEKARFLFPDNEQEQSKKQEKSTEKPENAEVVTFIPPVLETVDSFPQFSESDYE